MKSTVRNDWFFKYIKTKHLKKFNDFNLFRVCLKYPLKKIIISIKLSIQFVGFIKKC